MKIDLHVHTSDWSDGRDTAADCIKAAVEKGLDGIVITDHHRMLQPDEQVELKRQFPGFGIFRGTELSIGRDHVNLIGGTAEQIPSGKQKDSRFLKEYCERTGAFSMLNHPFWGGPQYWVEFDVFLPEAMDLASMNIDTGRKEIYMQTIREKQMLAVAASDAHKAREVGLFFVDLDNKVQTDEELLEELRAGRYTIGANEKMLEGRLREISREEKLAKKIIAEGGTEEDFKAAGGNFAYGRVSKGGSFMPPVEVIGLRGNAFRDA